MQVNGLTFYDEETDKNLSVFGMRINDSDSSTMKDLEDSGLFLYKVDDESNKLISGTPEDTNFVSDTFIKEVENGGCILTEDYNDSREFGKEYNSSVGNLDILIRSSVECERKDYLLDFLQQTLYEEVQSGNPLAWSVERTGGLLKFNFCGEEYIIEPYNSKELD